MSNHRAMKHIERAKELLGFGGESDAFDGNPYESRHSVTDEDIKTRMKNLSESNGISNQDDALERIRKWVEETGLNLLLFNNPYYNKEIIQLMETPSELQLNSQIDLKSQN